MAPDGSIVDRIDVNVTSQDQLAADLAFNGERYFVAWHDRRVAPEQVFCTQVTAAGAVLDPEGTRVPGQDSTNYQELVAVGSNGDGYLLAWLEFRVSGMAVRATRLSAAGVVLDSTPFELSTDTLGLDDVAVGSDGRDYIVLWTGETPGVVGADLCFRRVSAAGAVLDSTPVLVARSSLGLFSAKVDFLGDRYCAVWEGMTERADIYAARISTDGTVLDPDGFPVAADIAVQRQPDIANDGERFFVVWSEVIEDKSDILGAFVDTAGNVGVAAGQRRHVPAPSVPTLTRGLLHLPFSRTAHPAVLLDATGRATLNLQPGSNDVRRLSPGVYFVHRDCENAAARVVITR